MAEQNPFGTRGAGANAFKAAYDRLKAEADLARQNIGQDYASAYQQLRQQGYGQGLGAAAQAGMSGGQAEGIRQQIGAQQMNALGALMQGQEKALREQKVGEASMYSNALLEGQQAQQMENDRLNQIRTLLSNPDGSPKDLEDLTDIEIQQLKALGYNLPGNTGVRSPGVYDNAAIANKNRPAEKEGFTLRLVTAPFGRGSYWVYVDNVTGSQTRAR